MTNRIEVWQETLPGPNGHQQFTLLGLFYTWDNVWPVVNLLYPRWVIRTVQRPPAIQLLLQFA